MARAQAGEEGGGGVEGIIALFRRELAGQRRPLAILHHIGMPIGVDLHGPHARHHFELHQRQMAEGQSDEEQQRHEQIQSHRRHKGLGAPFAIGARQLTRLQHQGAGGAQDAAVETGNVLEQVVQQDPDRAAVHIARLAADGAEGTDQRLAAVGAVCGAAALFHDMGRGVFHRRRAARLQNGPDVAHAALRAAWRPAPQGTASGSPGISRPCRHRPRDDRPTWSRSSPWRFRSCR